MGRIYGETSDSFVMSLYFIRHKYVFPEPTRISLPSLIRFQPFCKNDESSPNPIVHIVFRVFQGDQDCYLIMIISVNSPILYLTR